MAITSGSCCNWFCWAMTRPNAAPTSPRPSTTLTIEGQPPRATKGASHALPPASARQRFCWAVSACRQTRAAPAQAKATGQNNCWLIPRPLVCTIHNKPVPSAASASSIPQSGRRGALTWLRRPRRVAASSPGAWLGGSAGSSSHSAPYAIAPMNWTNNNPTKPIRMTSTGQPKWRANPVQTPPSTAPSGTRVARGPRFARVGTRDLRARRRRTGRGGTGVE